MGSFFLIIFLLSIVLIVVGFFQYVFSKENKESGLKILIYGIVGLIIGFGSCIAMIYN